MTVCVDMKSMFSHKISLFCIDKLPLYVLHHVYSCGVD